MYKFSKPAQTTLYVNNSYEGESIEVKIRRVLSNNEPIDETAPIIYTERKAGVSPEHDIRTDRFEIAVEAMSAVDKANKAKREERHKTKEEPKTTGSDLGESGA